MERTNIHSNSRYAVPRWFAQRLLPLLVLPVPILILWHMFIFPIGLVHLLFGDVVEFLDKHFLQL